MESTTKTENGIVRGWWQGCAWADMKSENGCINPVASLRGRAKSYAGHYRDSFRNMLRRAERAGYRIERTPGPHGGEWSARYKVVGE